jgi:pyrroloquinoline quinone biosynthesis protein B
MQHLVPGAPMKVLVLGSRSGSATPSHSAARAPHRTQSSVALSADGVSWLLLNASPDIGEQIRANPVLHTRAGSAESPVKAVVLMDAQIEHVAGLLSLRDGPPLELHATPCVFEDLSTGLPLLQTLQHYCSVRWHIVPVAGESRVAAFRIAGFESLCFTAIATRGPAPAYATYRDGSTVGANIALYIEDSVTGQSLFYSPGPAQVGEDELAWMREADCLLLDAALEAGEAPTGPGEQPAAAPGHTGTMSTNMMNLLNRLRCRKVLAHLGLASPWLDAQDPDPQGALKRHGIELAHDGMEIEL